MLPRTAPTLSISWCPTRRRAAHWSNAFSYDHAGNRTGLTYFNGTSTVSYTYDYNTLNQLTSRTSGSFARSYLYDANGNRIRQQDVVSSTVMGTLEYDWNEDDRLVVVRVKNGQGNVTKTVRYDYCRTCGGQRTGRVEYDENDEVVEWLRYEMEGLNHLRIDEVFDADSNGELEDPAATGDAWRVQRVYVNGPGQLGQIAKVIVYNYASPTTGTPSGSDVYYYHYDILGNVSVISDPNGDEADQFEQDAFGNLVSGTWSGRVGGITEQITTKQYDEDLGLYYFNARWYDPQVGAFIVRDKGKPLSHMSWSVYVYAWDNPNTFYDVTGNGNSSIDKPSDKVLEEAWHELCRRWKEYNTLIDRLENDDLTRAERRRLLSKKIQCRKHISRLSHMLDEHLWRVLNLPAIRNRIAQWCCFRLVAAGLNVSILGGPVTGSLATLLLYPEDMGGTELCNVCGEGTWHPSSLVAWPCQHVVHPAVSPLPPPLVPSPHPSDEPTTSPPPHADGLIVCPAIIPGGIS